MASFFPLLQDLLPMIMPSSVHITRGSDITSSLQPPADPPATTEAAPQGVVISRNAIVNKTDAMCATVMVARPSSISAVHHYGEQEDAIIYVASGKGILLTSPDDEQTGPKRNELVKGDFAFIPSWTEHQVLNESEDEDSVWVVIRSGPQPVEVNLTDWGGPEVKPGNDRR